MRIDKTLWFLRMAKTRGAAQDLIARGHIRLNGRRIERASVGVEPGDVLVLPWREGVRMIELIALPQRRGPAPEAAACYRERDAALDGQPGNPIAAGNEPAARGNPQP